MVIGICIEIILHCKVEEMWTGVKRDILMAWRGAKLRAGAPTSQRAPNPFSRPLLEDLKIQEVRSSKGSLGCK